MFSCDTMIVSASHSKCGSNLFAKNSDRPTGEPQPLCFYAGGEHPAGATVQTTHIAIPQVAKTYAVVGSRPYWIWGFEMGYNEKGLVIGNEAEGSRMAPEEADGILGMDLLRLGLERAATAREAISVITSLLEQYGQKANASALTQRTYENSFILMDKWECWVLETAGRQWAAKEIKSAQGISNCYSITDDYDLCSDKLEAIARENRWLDPDEKFDFAKAYSGRLVAQPLGAQRFRRLNKLLAEKEKHDFASLSSILRDHFDGELIAPRFGENSLWWQVKALSLLVTVDENAFISEVRGKLGELEKLFSQKAEAAEQEARQLIKNGNQAEAHAKLYSVTEECTDMLYNFAKTERKRLASVIESKGGLYGRQKEAIEKYVAYARIPLLNA